MEGLGIVLAMYVGIGTLIGCIPLALLFVDYRRKREIHKPLIFLVAFIFTFVVLLPSLMRAFGLWLALIAPVVVMSYAWLAKAPAGRR